MTIEDQLKQYIRSKYKSIREFSEVAGLPPTTLNSALIRGIAGTKNTKVLNICRALNIDMEALLEGRIQEKRPDDFKLNAQEQSLISKYRALDNFGVDLVNKVITAEYNRNVFYANETPFAYKPLPEIGVSAGLGNEISDYSEMVKVPKSKVSMYSDYVIRVSGDSMEPLYYDGEYVLVKAQPDIDVGEIGIFIVDNESFIKEKGDGCLISKNKKYNPINLYEWNEVRCCGKVLEKTEILDN